MTNTVAMSVRRIIIYLLGIVSVSLGIVFCAGCRLGISPISSVPFTLQRLLPLSFGTLTMLFHLCNILAQYVLERRAWNPKVLLQVPIAVLFGWLINFFQGLLALAPETLPVKLLYLLVSVFLTALGMVLMLNMDLIQNPPDGTVRQVSRMTGKELGFVKRCYDAAMVLLTLVLDLAFFQDAYGLGLATVVSAFGVGKMVTILQKAIGKKLLQHA